MASKLHLLIMGPAGSGKGTQSEKIVEKYNLVHLSTGDMFRAAISNKTEAGLKAKTYMDDGKLVPDEITISLVKERLLADDIKERGFLLDGFPRTVGQARALKKLLSEIKMPLNLIIDLMVDRKVLEDRITGRRMCRKCGAIYHMDNKPPKVAGICDIDGGELYQRTDDTKESLEVRLKEYQMLTAPVRDYYEGDARIADINATQGVDKVFAEVDLELRRILND